MKLEVVVPVHTVSELNCRDHWRERHRRAKQQKELTTLLLRTSVKFDRQAMPPPYRVRLVRVSPRPIRDSDNLYSSTKAVRDAVAAFLGVNDADLVRGAEVSWSVEQRSEPKYAVCIEIESAGQADPHPITCPEAG